MNLEFLGYLLAGIVVCGIFGGIIYILAKKEQSDLEEKLNTLTQEQKDVLIDTPYQEALDCPNGVIVCGMIYEMKEKSTGSFSLYVLYYNTYFPNFREQICNMSINVSAKMVGEHNLKSGDYINVLLNEDKNPKIVFD